MHAQADAFRHKHDQFPTLTRLAGSYGLVGEAFSAILGRFGWRHVALFYHNYAVSSGKGHSLCHFSLGTVYTALNQTPVFRSFDETQDNLDFHTALKAIAAKARSESFSSLISISLSHNKTKQTGTISTNHTE
jgi:hypothetical protein